MISEWLNIGTRPKIALLAGFWLLLLLLGLLLDILDSHRTASCNLQGCD